MNIDGEVQKLNLSSQENPNDYHISHWENGNYTVTTKFKEVSNDSLDENTESEIQKYKGTVEVVEKSTEINVILDVFGYCGC